MSRPTSPAPALSFRPFAAALLPAAARTWPFDKLSPRELEVAMLMLEGLPFKAIAHHLQISPKTVDTHRAQMYKRLGIDCAVALAYLAIGTGVLEIPRVAEVAVPFAHPEPPAPFDWLRDKFVDTTEASEIDPDWPGETEHDDLTAEEFLSWMMSDDQHVA